MNLIRHSPYEFPIRDCPICHCTFQFKKEETLSNESKITCPTCSCVFPVEHYELINYSLRPESYIYEWMLITKGQKGYHTVL